MCLLAISFQPENEENKFLVIANRDEFYARPTLDADWWCSDDCSNATLGCRDLKSGGTWLAVNKNGRFAAVTNYSFETVAGKYSRGQLVTDFLESSLPAMEYLESIVVEDYAGFNLIVYDDQSSTLAYLSNRVDKTRPALRRLSPGVYGLSNATLDEPWSKVNLLKTGLVQLEKEQLLHHSEELFSLLGVGNNMSERRPSLMQASFTSVSTDSSDLSALYEYLDESSSYAFDDDDDELPLEHTSPFLFRPSKGYGTRCSTVVRCHQNGHWEFTERRFDETGKSTGETHKDFVSKTDGM